MSGHSAVFAPPSKQVGSSLLLHSHPVEASKLNGFGQVHIVNRTQQRAAELVQTLQSDLARLKLSSLALDHKEDIQRVLGQADVVVTATNSAQPLFDGNWLSPGCHVCAVGSYTPDMHELDAVTVQRSRVIIDTAAAKAVGDFQVADIQPNEFLNLGDLVANTAQLPPPADKKNITLFKSVGTAVQDIASAWKVYERAQAAGVGTLVDL
eukprot:m.195470 g.195470  ORF g.195470 m.195470 type:complete len:209 (+) comp21817_c1_seq3:438-1064(+)